MKSISLLGNKRPLPFYHVYSDDRIKNSADLAYEERNDMTITSEFNTTVDQAVISEKERIESLRETIERTAQEGQKVAALKYREMFPSSNLALIRGLLNNDPTIMSQLGVDEHNISTQNLVELNQKSINDQYLIQQKGYVAGLVNSNSYGPISR